MWLLSRVMNKKPTAPSTSATGTSSSSPTSNPNSSNNAQVAVLGRPEDYGPGVELIARRVHAILDDLAPYVLSHAPFDWIDCPTLSFLASDTEPNPCDTRRVNERPQRIIDRNEHWPLSEIRQLPRILEPCIIHGMTAYELGIFIVTMLYHRDRQLGGMVTLLVDAGSTYAAVGTNIVRYLCLYDDQGALWSEHLRLGDTEARPMWNTGGGTQRTVGIAQNLPPPSFVSIFRLPFTNTRIASAIGLGSILRLGPAH
ncbi:hypothetical protein MPDQ_007132 [Monascus purpureus]|uniref:Uncharacterized protein n=1 Tax=Monascus purpureus TaxID=5098 RepID=A0A507QX49_MONPU|nr:hypothetical protein MPDQ_007132 [Monascus purpureus]